MITHIKHEGMCVCCISERRHYGGDKYYEIVFPSDETLKSVTRATVPEIHAWLDSWCGKGEWTVE